MIAHIANMIAAFQVLKVAAGCSKITMDQSLLARSAMMMANTFQLLTDKARNMPRYNAGDYAQKRLSTNRDDRCDPSKMWDDAKLRGEIGTKRANEIIAAIDGIKSNR